MKRQYQVTFSKNGYVVSKSIQIASSEKEAIDFARMCHRVGKSKARAVLVSQLEND